MGLLEDKKELRKHMGALGGIDGDARKQAEDAILSCLLELPAYRYAKTIFTYIGIGHEPDTMPFIKYALGDGKTVAAPALLGDGMMEARIIESTEELRRTGAFNILEPPAGAEVLPGIEIDLALVPGICFDYDGNRLGRGKGYYDKYLEKTLSYMAGVCFFAYLTRDIPHDGHDVRMDAVVTENGIIVSGTW